MQQSLQNPESSRRVQASPVDGAPEIHHRRAWSTRKGPAKASFQSMATAGCAWSETTRVLHAFAGNPPSAPSRISDGTSGLRLASRGAFCCGSKTQRSAISTSGALPPSGARSGRQDRCTRWSRSVDTSTSKPPRTYADAASESVRRATSLTVDVARLKRSIQHGLACVRFVDVRQTRAPSVNETKGSTAVPSSRGGKRRARKTKHWRTFGTSLCADRASFSAQSSGSASGNAAS
mmetsp:Transcript_19466/g.65780  ORF Transcript_19466/g.65780 Transcript_19466/m.65780 type:complete len:235 (-) Transcript_19466:168-872(-)